MKASPRTSFASGTARKSVEESTIDYGIMKEIPEVLESSITISIKTFITISIEVAKP